MREFSNPTNPRSSLSPPPPSALCFQPTSRQHLHFKFGNGHMDSGKDHGRGERDQTGLMLSSLLALIPKAQPQPRPQTPNHAIAVSPSPYIATPTRALLIPLLLMPHRIPRLIQPIRLPPMYPLVKHPTALSPFPIRPSTTRQPPRTRSGKLFVRWFVGNTHIRSLLPDLLLKLRAPHPLLLLRIRLLLLARPSSRGRAGQVALLAAAGTVPVFDVLDAGGGDEGAERVEGGGGLDG